MEEWSTWERNHVLGGGNFHERIHQVLILHTSFVLKIKMLGLQLTCQQIPRYDSKYGSLDAALELKIFYIIHIVKTLKIDHFIRVLEV